MSRQVRPRLCLSPLVSLKKRKRAVFKHLKKNQTTHSKETSNNPLERDLNFEIDRRSVHVHLQLQGSKRKRERERERERERGGGALPKDISKSELSFFSFLSVSSSYLFLRIFWSPLESYTQLLILIFSGSIPHHLLLPFQCPSSLSFLFSSILRLCSCQLEGFSLPRLRPLTLLLLFIYIF